MPLHSTLGHAVSSTDRTIATLTVLGYGE